MKDSHLVKLLRTEQFIYRLLDKTQNIFYKCTNYIFPDYNNKSKKRQEISFVGSRKPITKKQIRKLRRRRNAARVEYRQNCTIRPETWDWYADF